MKNQRMHCVLSLWLLWENRPRKWVCTSNGRLSRHETQNGWNDHILADKNQSLCLSAERNVFWFVKTGNWLTAHCNSTHYGVHDPLFPINNAHTHRPKWSAIGAGLLVVNCSLSLCGFGFFQPCCLIFSQVQLSHVKPAHLPLGCRFVKPILCDIRRKHVDSLE